MYLEDLHRETTSKHAALKASGSPLALALQYACFVDNLRIHHDITALNNLSGYLMFLRIVVDNQRIEPNIRIHKAIGGRLISGHRFRLGLKVESREYVKGLREAGQSKYG